MEVWDKNRWVFYLFAILEKYMFCVHSMGNGPVEGAITSILKQLKG